MRSIMPDGKTHNIINTVVLLAFLAGLSYIYSTRSYAHFMEYLDIYTIIVFSLSYLFATFFLSPDLDIDSTPYRRWRFLRFLWWPYKEIFHHRGLSHNPVIGPLSILFNFSLIVAPMLYIAKVDPMTIPMGLLVAAVMGIVLSIEVHIISDRCT
jgi:uncharacterized metal-binding protein